MFAKNALYTFMALITLLFSKGYATDLETLKEKMGGSQRSMTLTASLGSNLNEVSTADHSFDTDFSLDPSVVLPGGTVLIANLSFRKSLEGERKEYFNDVYAGATKTFYQKGAFSLSYLALGFIPVSKTSQDDTYLNTGLMLAPTLSLDLGEYGLSGLRVSLRPSVRVNSHRYKTSKSGNSNSQYVTSGLLSVYYYVTDKFYLSARNSYVKSFTYLGNTTDRYQFSQALTYRAFQNTRIEVGHANGGNPLAPEGTQTDIKLFDARSSQVYAALSYTF